MTKQEAYRIIGVNSISNRSKIEKAYISKLRKRQRQLITGYSISIRQRAQQQIAQLASAMEVLQKNPTRTSVIPQSSRKRSSPQRPGNQHPQQQSSSWKGWPGFFDLMPLPKSAVIMALLLSALIMLLIALSCYRLE